jgi:hypothetical protein
MNDNGSICTKSAIKHLEKLIGIEHQIDFVDKNFSNDQYDQIRRNALTMTYGQEALNQIKCQLGYLPRREATFESEGAIQLLLFEYMHHHLNIDLLFDGCSPHLDEIFAREITPHAIDDYPIEIYRLYNTLFTEHAEVARNRILMFSENQPNLNQSLYAELAMRCRIAEGVIEFGNKRNEADYEAEGIIWFRMQKENDLKR